MTPDIPTALAASRDLAGLAPESLAVIADHASLVRFGRGEAILRVGVLADRFWIVADGTVDVELHGPGVGAVTIARLGLGDVIGVSWTAPPHLAELDVTAATDTVAVEVDASALLDRCETDPVFGRDLFRCFTGVLRRRLHATRLQLLDLYGPRR